MNGLAGGYRSTPPVFEGIGFSIGDQAVDIEQPVVPLIGETTDLPGVDVIALSGGR